VLLRLPDWLANTAVVARDAGDKMIDDLKTLAIIAVGACLAGFFGYFGWDAAQTLLPWLLGALGR